MVNPDWLRTFLTLAETRHFTQTASRLGMTQPGVSQHLKKLEDHYGASLVHRDARTFSLTEAGRTVQAFAQRLFAEHDQLSRGLRVDDPHVGRCRYAAPGSFGLRLFDTLLELGAKHPGLAMELTVAPNAQIPTLLTEEKIDVGFMTHIPTQTELSHRVIGKEPLRLVLPKRHARRTNFEDLLRIGFVNHPDGFHFAGRLFDANFPSRFRGMAEFPVRVFINQISRILDPVAAGLGFTVLPETAAEKYRGPEVSLVPLKREIVDPLVRVWRKGPPLPARYALVDRAL